MASKIGATACLAFHPLKVSLAAGYADNTVAVYVSSSDSKQQPAPQLQQQSHQTHQLQQQQHQSQQLLSQQSQQLLHHQQQQQHQLRNS